MNTKNINDKRLTGMKIYICREAVQKKQMYINVSEHVLCELA